MIINDIIKAISNALDSEFNYTDSYEIYDREIPQDLKEPAFYIQSLNPSFIKFPSERYLMHNHMVIQYFPESKADYQEECNDVGERMTWALEWIFCAEEDKPTHGTHIHFEVIDGVLNFFVDYEFFVRKEQVKDLMETMKLEQTVN